MTGKINDDAGKIEASTGLISQEPGLINDNTGMLEGNAGLIDEDSGLITENSIEEDTPTGRRKRSIERGKDLKTRNFPLHTLKNLPQFRNKTHEEVRQYILDTKGVNIGGNTSTAKIVLIIIGVLLAGLGMLYLYDRYKNKENNKE